MLRLHSAYSRIPKFYRRGVAISTLIGALVGSQALISIVEEETLFNPVSNVDQISRYLAKHISNTGASIAICTFNGFVIGLMWPITWSSIIYGFWQQKRRWSSNDE
jgi:hypothetical protein